MTTIRRENPDDIEGIRHVLEEAFHQSSEADLVELLRQQDAITLALVAIKGDQVVGYIMFSPVTIDSEYSSLDAIGLGPMAVLPQHQGKGIGSELVRDGLEECGQAGHEIVVVLGHAEYYPRFGFAPARPRGVRCEFDVPDDVFMIMELRAGALSGKTGMVRYRPEFRSV